MHKIQEHNGELTPSQIADGMNCVSQNALRLYRSSKLVYEAGDFPTAASLAVLAIEESGKLPILRGLAMAETRTDVVQCWKDYKKHLEKNRMTGCLVNVRSGKMKLEDFRGEYSGENNKVSVRLDNLKQFGLYVNCLKGPRWVSPCDMISKESAEAVLRYAEIQCTNLKEVTSREIELWHECLAPVAHSSWHEMQQGLLKWHHLMVAEGLREDDEGFIHFVLDGHDFLKDNVAGNENVK